MARRTITNNYKMGLDIETLGEDLKNGPKHIFGDHKMCKDYYCKIDKNESVSFSVDTQKVLERVEDILKPLIRKAPQLITNDTSNENFMSLVAKFTGGKQISRGKKGSFTHRTYGAALDFQYGPHWTHKTWKKTTLISPFSPLRKFAEKTNKQMDYKRKSLYNSFMDSSKNKKVKIIQKSGEEDYGEYCQKLDMDEEDYELEKIQFLKILQVTEDTRKDIEQKTIGKSDNSNWFEARKNRLTASNFGTICKRLKTTKYGPTVHRLLYKDNNEQLPALQYGRLNGPEAVRQYEKEKNVKVLPCGLFVDLHIGFLAATPDGLIEPNGIIEVKCPISIRTLGIKFAVKNKKSFYLKYNENTQQIYLNKNHEYYYQIQGQLHISNRDFCDFVVWTPKEIHIERIQRDDMFWEKKMEEQLI